MARDRRSDAHRIIASRAAGRKLSPKEVVHHLDESKDNNHPDNLKVMDRSAHTKQHNKARGLSKLRKALSMVARKEKLY